MMFKLAWAGFSALLLAACATVQTPPTIPVSSAWSDSAVAWSEGVGNSAVTGQAVLRTVGGEIRTCAGLEAVLIPDSAYARERLLFDFRRLEQGFKARTQTYFFAPDPAGYHATQRTAICDAQGTFTFEGIPTGKYYVAALVSWGVADVRYGTTFTPEQGGWVLGTVEVATSQTKRIVLTA